MHLDYETNLFRFNLAAIWLEVMEADVRLQKRNDPVPLMTSVVIGSYLYDDLMDQLVLALDQQEHVISLSFSTVLARPLAAYVDNRANLAAGLPLLQRERKFHDVPVEWRWDPSPSSLKHLPKLLRHLESGSDIGEEMGAVLFARLVDQLCGRCQAGAQYLVCHLDPLVHAALRAYARFVRRVDLLSITAK